MTAGGFLRSPLSRWTSVLCLAGAVAATPAAARVAPASPVPLFGVNGGQLWRDTGGDLPTARHARAIAAAGFRSVRAIAWWHEVEPRSPEQTGGTPRFDWTPTDRIASELARAGLRWDVILGFSSPWGSAVGGVGLLPPRTAPFAAYAAAVAARYGHRGAFWAAHPELPYAPVLSYEVWNEENIASSWIPQPAPAAYADLYSSTRAAVLRSDPNARVAVGALATSAGTDGTGGFLSQMLAARPGLAGEIDAVGVNAYADAPQGVLARVAAVRATLDRAGGTRVPLDVDETGWTTSGIAPLSDISPVSDAVRGTRFAALVPLLRGSDCGIATIMPFAWVTAENDRTDASAWFGVSDRLTAELKPSGVALARAVRDAEASAPAPAGPPVCGRPDLPRPGAAEPPAPEPFAVRVTPRCRARRLHVDLTRGPEPEPYARLTVRAGRRTWTSADPDGGGPALARTSLGLPAPSRRTRLVAEASDELGRLRARATAIIRPCARRRGALPSPKRSR